MTRSISEKLLSILSVFSVRHSELFDSVCFYFPAKRKLHGVTLTMSSARTSDRAGDDEIIEFILPWPKKVLMSSEKTSDKVYGRGEIFQFTKRFADRGGPFLISIRYEDRVLSRVLPQLARILSQSGVQGISAEDVLHRVVGLSDDPLTLTGLKFKNKRFYKMEGGQSMKKVFMRKERALAEEMLRIIFCDSDTVAANASPIALRVGMTELEFDFDMAFRKAVVKYHAEGSEPGDVIRVTIRGVGINSPSTMKFERSSAWYTHRYRDFVLRSEVCKDSFVKLLRGLTPCIADFQEHDQRG